MILKEIGSEIIRLRKKNNISQEQLSKISGIDRSYIACIESGKKNLSVLYLDKIINCLNTLWLEFFNDIVDHSQQK